MCNFLLDRHLAAYKDSEHHLQLYNNTWSGMGSYHQTRHAVSEEDQSPAAAVGRLPARDAC